MTVTDNANVPPARPSESRSVTDSVNVPTAGNSPNGNAELLDFYRRAEAQQAWRSFPCTCRRCGRAFEYKIRGWLRSGRQQICPDCHSTRIKAYAREWRDKRKAERLEAQLDRACECRWQPHAGRSRRRYCSPACKQKSFRRRNAA